MKISHLRLKSTLQDRPEPDFVIADDDQIIPAPLQTFFAERMGATEVHVSASHVAMLSAPEAVADAILAAVRGEG